ncbi:fungal specific transcription factor domain-containing protein [Aspergillus alliaceus]|uniref:fungal specific transcription factor domain-containing protein n=1 Tax=Petromyces alliaceus TaxID=209559 RepID=UPI0012A7794A|nr:uncharacterized protein BDW43DRAFT_287993 [Aspergillus alliaceus]KAB8229620.1 hypothetical protein BDW43DRAFT_287993 [Aspergillus alliaceus]
MNGDLISKEEGLELLDAYFTLFFPSSFVCDPSRVKDRYHEGTLPISVRSSIFSVAALLLKPSPTIRLADVGRSWSVTTRPGEIWAKQASAIVAAQIHWPSFDIIPSLFNLIVYWCGVGRGEKCREIAKMAVVCSQRLKAQESSQELEPSFFYVGLISQCLTGEDEHVASSPPLHYHAPLRTSDIECRTPRREMMQMVEHWIRIRHFVGALHTNVDPGMQWAALFNFDAETRRMYEMFSPTLCAFDGRRHHEVDFRECLGLQTLYHICRILPHLAMILFLQEQQPSPEYTQLCIEVAVGHINQVSDTIMNFVASTQTSLATLPPFAAYSSFISVSVYLSYLNHYGRDWHCPNSPALDLSKMRLLSHLYLLHQLRRVWAPVRILWDVIEPEMNSMGITIAMIEDHGKTMVTSYDGVSRMSYLPDQCLSAERQVETEMILGFRDIVRRVKLVDPAYMLIGVFRLFPVGARSSAMPSSSSSDHIVGRGEIYPAPLQHITSGPTSDVLFAHPNRQQHEQYSQGSATPTAPNHSSPFDIDPGETTSGNGYPSTSLRNAAENSIEPVGMLQMMWLPGEDIF